MGWAERRVREYNEGQQATWIERRVLDHANPVHVALAMIAVIPFVYGLWTHNWLAIGLGVLLNVVGHVYCGLRK